jgi:hypothetical protein
MKENNIRYKEFRCSEPGIFSLSFEIRCIKPNLSWQLICLKNKIYLHHYTILSLLPKNIYFFFLQYFFIYDVLYHFRSWSQHN